ncbi:NB-ARC domain containing protein [Parasponia andersonii]|uniref:NB-ARC domain containing protein n=1 Tax=Parasponia andersonii TaxID=3476 RepID=A0A2P5DAC6_PARAD|nr:NB-ARC domain containing protein [Parasponia andersonii]
MGGLGKTTLARKIYQHCKIRGHFDCLAWASISQQCQVSNVWKEILVKLCVDEKEKIKEMEDSEIARRLYSFGTKDGKRKKELGKKMLKYCAGLPFAHHCAQRTFIQKANSF